MYFTLRDLTQSYWIVKGLIGGILAGLSVRDRKLAQGVSECTILDSEGSNRTLIEGLGFL